MDILRDFTPSHIQQAIDANEIAYGSFLSRRPQAILHDDPGICWFESEFSFNIFNGVLHTYLTPDTLTTAIDRVLTHFEQRGLPFQWHVGPTSQPTNLGDILQARGIVHDYDEPGMAVDLLALQEDLQVSSELVIQPVTSREQVRQWAQVWGCGVTPDEIIRQFFIGHTDLPLGPESPLQMYMGILNGEPVATSALFLGGGVACIKNVVTLHHARRQGIGAAMTLMAAREARQQGYRVGVLSASPFGIGIYRCLGFRQYCTLSIYQWSPTRNQNQATSV